MSANPSILTLPPGTDLLEYGKVAPWGRLDPEWKKKKSNPIKKRPVSPPNRPTSPTKPTPKPIQKPPSKQKPTTVRPIRKKAPKVSRPTGITADLWSQLSATEKAMASAIGQAAREHSTLRVRYTPKVQTQPGGPQFGKPQTVNRTVEPYSLRTRNIHAAPGGYDVPAIAKIVFFGYDKFDEDGATIKMFCLDRIRSVTYAGRTFEPQWDVEWESQKVVDNLIESETDGGFVTEIAGVPVRQHRATPDYYHPGADASFIITDEGQIIEEEGSVIHADIRFNRFGKGGERWSKQHEVNAGYEHGSVCYLWYMPDEQQVTALIFQYGCDEIFVWRWVAETAERVVDQLIELTGCAAAGPYEVPLGAVPQGQPKKRKRRRGSKVPQPV